MLRPTTPVRALALLLTTLTAAPLLPGSPQSLPVARGASPPSSAAGSADTTRVWPQWRGPGRDGRVAGTPWPTTLEASRLTCAFEVTGLGESYATPLVTESLVVTIGTVGKHEEVATAFDRRTGEKRWERRWEGAMSVPFFAAKNGSWVRSSPATDGERVVLGGMRDVVVCLDLATGEERWRVDFVARHDSPLPAFGLVCSPLIVGEAVYVQAGASLAKLDVHTGETLWRALADQGGGMDSAFSSPVLATLAGREQLVVQSRTHLSGVDPATGALLWTQEVPAFRGMNILTPLVHGEGVFTTAYGGRAHLYTIAAAPAASAEAPALPFTVAEAWSARAQGYMTSPVTIGGAAYLFLRSNRFTCVDLATGEDRYISPPTGDEYWSLVAQGEQILALSDTGRLRLIAANPAEYQVRGEVALVEGPSWAHLAVTSPLAAEEDEPAPSEGADLFVRAQTSLHAFRWR